MLICSCLDGPCGCPARPYLQKELVLEHPLHGDDERVLQPELPTLNLQGALLGMGRAVGEDSSPPGKGQNPAIP